MKDALEHNYDVDPLPAKHPIVAWMVQCAGAQLARFAVGADGMTAYRRHRGKEYNREIPEFGECIHYMPVKRGRLLKLEPRFEDGVFLGIREESDELFVGTPDGVYKVRNVRRKPMSQRWDKKFMLSIRGKPWSPNPSEEESDVLPGPVVVHRAQNDGLPVPIPPTPIDPVPRRLYILRRDLEKHGFTPGCLGCASVRNGTQPQL